MVMAEEDIPADAATRRGGVNLFTVLPGGVAPEPEETAVAAIIIGALIVVFLIRRGFGSVLNK